VWIAPIGTVAKYIQKQVGVVRVVFRKEKAPATHHAPEALALRNHSQDASDCGVKRRVRLGFGKTFVIFTIAHLVVISKTILNEFGRHHADAAEALNEWYDRVTAADWKHSNDVRRQFNSVDYVGDNRFVFNIRGNQYRLVALVFFSVRTVYIKFVGTHAEYNRVDVRTIDQKKP